MKSISLNDGAAQRKLVLAAAMAAVGAGTLTQIAKADVIQVNFDYNSSNFTLGTATSGAPGGDYATWNNEGPTVATGASLTMVSGSLSTATLTYASTLDYDTIDASNSNEKLLYSWICENNSTSAATATVSGLSASGFTNYDVYVYVESNSVTNASISIGSAMYYFTAEKTSVGTTESSADFVPITDSTGYAGVSAGDYAEFTGLTGDSFTIDINDEYGTSGNTAGISGFQIVEVPEPAAMSLVGLSGAALLRRRRRRDRVVQT